MSDNYKRVAKLFEDLKLSGQSGNARAKANAKLRMEGYTDIEIRTARALLNNTIDMLNEKKDQAVMDFFHGKNGQLDSTKDNLDLPNDEEGLTYDELEFINMVLSLHFKNMLNNKIEPDVHHLSAWKKIKNKLTH